MHNRNYLRLSAFAAALLMLCSCGNTNSAKPEDTSEAVTTSAVSADSPAAEQTSTEGTTAEPQKTTQPAVTSDEPDLSELSDAEKRQLIIEKAMLQTGNTERLLKVFEKAEKGEEVVVAYIGGSITEGYTLKPEECWAKLTYDYLCEKYPDAKIRYVNAGMSGTPSTLGLIRFDRDVLGAYGDPDLVFIEFAVNDAQDSVSKEAYECLVRKAYGSGSDPAVILMFMRTDIGYTCQDHQSEIGYNYGLPMISLNDGLSWAIDNGIMTWEEYSNDGAHPNPDGSILIAEMVEKMYESVLEGVSYGDHEVPDVKKVEDVTPLYGDSFVEMSMLDNGNITPVSIGEYSETEVLNTFPNGWTRKVGDNEGISFEMTFDDLFIVYHCNKSKRFATADVYIDGELETSVNSSSEDGWSNPVPQLVHKGDGKAETHTVELKMHEGFEKDYFGILAFGVTDS